MALASDQWRTVQECLAAELDGVSPDTVTPEMHLREDLEYDSLRATNLAFELEDKFAITISEADLASIETVGDLVHVIEAKLPA